MNKSLLTTDIKPCYPAALVSAVSTVCAEEIQRARGAFNMAIKLVSNIIKTPNNDTFRKVFRTPRAAAFRLSYRHTLLHAHVRMLHACHPTVSVITPSVRSRLGCVQMRLNHPKLSAQLFSVSGGTALLTSVGFASTINEAGENVLVLPIQAPLAALRQCQLALKEALDLLTSGKKMSNEDSATPILPQRMATLEREIRKEWKLQEERVNNFREKRPRDEGETTEISKSQYPTTAGGENASAPVSGIDDQKLPPLPPPGVTRTKSEKMRLIDQANQFLEQIDMTQSEEDKKRLLAEAERILGIPLDSLGISKFRGTCSCPNCMLWNSKLPLSRQPEAQAEYIWCTLPEGCVAGSELVVSYQGREISFIAPEGSVAGQRIKVQMPPRASPTSSGMNGSMLYDMTSGPAAATAPDATSKAKSGATGGALDKLTQALNSITQREYEDTWAEAMHFTIKDLIVSMATAPKLSVPSVGRSVSTVAAAAASAVRDELASARDKLTWTNGSHPGAT